MSRKVAENILKGTISNPPSKSDGQRVLLAAALAKGVSTVSNLGNSNDVLVMLRNIEILGAQVIQISPSIVQIKGIDNFPEQAQVDIGESGLGLRLLTAVCACHSGTHKFIGHGSILKRSQNFYKQNFDSKEIKIKSNNGFLPIEISGTLVGGKYLVDGSMSSQYISGLLMGLPLLKENSILEVTNLKSTPYVSMTLNTLNHFGIEIEQTNFPHFKIKGNQNYESTNYKVEADWSSASYWLVAAALGNEITLTGLNLESYQADRAMLKALETANCEVIVEEGRIKVNGNFRASFSFDATDCPDLFPALVTLAAFCDGVSILKGVRRLINKESNRGLVLQTEFAKLGLKIELIDNEMRVHGGSHLKSARLDSHNDHRIAMCLAIAGTKINGGVSIENPEVVSKSYPEFWNDLERLIIR